MRAAGASISLPFPRRRRRSSIRRRLAPVRQDGEHHGERGGERDEHVAQRTHHRIENEAGGATQTVSHPWEVRPSAGRLLCANLGNRDGRSEQGATPGGTAESAAPGGSARGQRFGDPLQNRVAFSIHPDPKLRPPGSPCSISCPKLELKVR